MKVTSDLSDQFSFSKFDIFVGPWSNGYQCGMQIPQPGFSSQRVPDHGC